MAPGHRERYRTQLIILLADALCSSSVLISRLAIPQNCLLGPNKETDLELSLKELDSGVSWRQLVSETGECSECDNLATVIELRTSIKSLERELRGAREEWRYVKRMLMREG